MLGTRARRIPGVAAMWPGARAAGFALPVRAVGGDNLALHRALAAAREGEILVVDGGGGETVGVWGALMTIAAQTARVEAIVVDGAVRDLAEISRRHFPVFATGTAPHAATKQAPGTVGEAIRIRGVDVEPGDLVVADSDGVVVVEADLVDDVVESVRTLRRRERAIARRLRRGESTVAVLGLADVEA